MNMLSPESLEDGQALRRRIAALDRGGGWRHQDLAPISTGHAALDRSLDGGLARGVVHELLAEAGEGPALTGFGIALAVRAMGSEAPLLWLRTEAAEADNGKVHAPGLAEHGLDPARLVIGVMKDDLMLLRAAADAARCGELGALLVEMRGNPPLLDLTASRRLALAAERSGVPVILLRLEAVAGPSAAETRWSVAAAPSAVFDPDVPESPGHPAFDLRLLRRRAGPDGLAWRLEWNRDRRAFQDSPLPGAVLPASGDRSASHRPA